MAINSAANQHIDDPRQSAFWDAYIARGLRNAYQAAIEAGYSEDSARCVTIRDWFKEGLQRERDKDGIELEHLGRKKLKEILTLPSTEITKDGTEKINTSLLSIQNNAAQAVGISKQGVTVNNSITMAGIIQLINKDD
jgi:phage terminase small subunit